MLLKIFVVLLPWPIRRRALIALYGYEIDPTARIGVSWIFPKKLRMGKYARVDHLTVAINIDLVEMGDFSLVGRSNWITGHRSGSTTHYQHQFDRKPQLLMGRHSAVTRRHHIDCTNTVTIGEFSTIAGYDSQVLTHSIDIEEGRQSSKPVDIGDYCFVGTRCVILGGASLPSKSVLAAGAVLTKKCDIGYSLYGGVPAARIKALPQHSKYFLRDAGFVS